MHADCDGVGERKVFIEPEQPAPLSGFQTSMPLGTDETHGAFIVGRDFMSSLNT